MSTIEEIIDRINFHSMLGHRVPACRHCDIPCDPTTREYRATKLCQQCYDDLGPITVVKKGRNHATVPTNHNLPTMG